MTRTPDSSVFDGAMASWQEWQEAPWGRLRYSVAAANLARHLDGDVLDVLDIGGGSGLDAIPLAMAGHQVVLADYSERMLEAASENAEKAGVPERIRILHSRLEELPFALGPDAFDVVLCHNVLQYVDDVPAALSVALAACRPHGVLSVICPNATAEPLRLAVRDLDLAAALEAVDAVSSFSKAFQVSVRRLVADDVIESLTAVGCHITGHYGIRCVGDYISDESRKKEPDFFAALEALEIALSTRPAYLGSARFFHVVAVSP